MILILPIPTTDYSTFQIELDGLVYTMTFRYNTPIEQPPYYTMDLLTGDGTPIYQGVKLVSGVRLCYTSGHPAQPAGYLGVGIISGSPTAPPTKEDFATGKAVLFYDSAI